MAVARFGSSSAFSIAPACSDQETSIPIFKFLTKPNYSPSTNTGDSMSLGLSRHVLRRHLQSSTRQIVFRRHATTTSEAAGAVKQTASELASTAKDKVAPVASKASDGLTKVASQAGDYASKAGAAAGRLVGGIGGRTGRLIGAIQGKSTAISSVNLSQWLRCESNVVLFEII